MRVGFYNTLHVNFWGNPGVGKTRLASQLHGCLSGKGYSSELIREYARELNARDDLYKKNKHTDEACETEQVIISSEQFRREAEYEDLVQVIISDAPILQGMVFSPDYYRSELTSIFRHLTAGWKTLDILLQGDIKVDYQSRGKIQNAEESMALRPEIEAILIAERPDFIRLHADEALDRVLDAVVDHLEKIRSYAPSF